MSASTANSIKNTFDVLVTEGVIVSGPYESIHHEDEGYPVSALGGKMLVAC
jgi:hypothetical protein